MLYAIEEMHYEPHIEVIVALIGDACLEVRLQSYLLFEKARANLLFFEDIKKLKRK